MWDRVTNNFCPVSQTNASDKPLIKKNDYIGTDPPHSTVAHGYHRQAHKQTVGNIQKPCVRSVKNS